MPDWYKRRAPTERVPPVQLPGGYRPDIAFELSRDTITEHVRNRGRGRRH
jgi:hypothetical protein